jgi:hypothetical protein
MYFNRGVCLPSQHKSAAWWGHFHRLPPCDWPYSAASCALSLSTRALECSGAGVRINLQTRCSHSALIDSFAPLPRGTLATSTPPFGSSAQPLHQLVLRSCAQLFGGRVYQGRQAQWDWLSGKAQELLVCLVGPGARCHRTTHLCSPRAHRLSLTRLSLGADVLGCCHASKRQSDIFCCTGVPAVPACGRQEHVSQRAGMPAHLGMPVAMLAAQMF